MNTKTLVLLALVAVAAVTAVVLTGPELETRKSAGQALVPALVQNINQVSEVRIFKAGNTLVADLKRGDQGWVVANQSNYPADTGELREALLRLADAKLLEEKTANPENYARLGVQDLSDPKATGTRVELGGLAEPVNLIFGHPALGGTYARRTGEAQSWLVSGDLELGQELSQWLDQRLLDIPAGRIQAVTIRQPDGATLRLEKQVRDQADFAVAAVPAGRELKSARAADSVGEALTGLQLESVTPAGQIQPGNGKPVEAEYRTFDGLVIAATLFKAGDKPYLRAQARFDEAQAKRFVAAAAGDKPASAAGAPAPAEPATIREEAQKLNDRLAPWTYEIAAFKYETLTRRLEDLLKPPPAASGGHQSTAPAAEAPPAVDESLPEAEPLPEPGSEAEVEESLEEGVPLEGAQQVLPFPDDEEEGVDEGEPAAEQPK